MKTLTSAQLLFLVAALSVTVVPSTAQQNTAASSNILASFSHESQTTLATLQNLAVESQTVIGVSGTWIGVDDRLISVSKQNATLSDILDDICRADPRFSWKEATDGSIQMHLGKEHLGLADVIVTSLSAKTITPDNLLSEVLMMAEVKAWSERNACGVGKTITGGEKRTFEKPISDLASGQPLWKVLDQIARRTNHYFWSMVKFSNTPCSINLNP